MIILSIIYFVLAMLGVIGFFWMVIGIPVGIVLVILYLSKSAKKKEIRQVKRIVLAFCGLPLLVVTFTLWAILQVVTTFFNVSPFYLTKPQVPVYENNSINTLK